MKKIAVYTVMIGDYDKYIDFPNKFQENDIIDYYYFTDCKNKIVDGYKMIYIKDEGYGNKLNQRFYKILITDILDKYEYSIYYDGNVRVTAKLSPLIKLIGNNDMMVFNYIFPFNVYYQFLHPYFGIYSKKNNFHDLYKKYLDDGWRDNKINSTNKFIIKKHSKHMKNFLNFWFNETLKVGRDEFTLMYSVFKFNIKLKVINGLTLIKYFDVYLHRDEDVKKTTGFNKIIRPSCFKRIKMCMKNNLVDLILCYLLSFIFQIIKIFLYIFK